jgi:hypothetical protein
MKKTMYAALITCTLATLFTGCKKEGGNATQLRITSFAPMEAAHDEIDFTKNINLEELYCQDTQIGFVMYYTVLPIGTTKYEMDLTKCTKLSRLYCANNPYIKEVWVSKMPATVDKGTVSVVVK